MIIKSRMSTEIDKFQMKELIWRMAELKSVGLYAEIYVYILDFSILTPEICIQWLKKICKFE